MREVMRSAEVGDMMAGEDPTVNALEARVAELTGMEAAMFVISGTMGNQVALRVHAHRKIAPELILHERAHIYLNESAGLALVGGMQAKPVPGPRGVMPIEAIERHIHRGWRLNPQTCAIAVENTHNYEGGAVVPLDHMRAIKTLAEEHDLPVHLDGARVFNAAVAMNRPLRDIAATVDTLQFCFSKGLGCPVGSVVAGPAEFIEQALRVRQSLGGAMRQAGVIAAPALVALDKGIDLLADDHRRCQQIAAALGTTSYDVTPPDTNILVLGTTRTAKRNSEIVEHCRQQGVLILPISPTQLRLVTHRDIDDGQTKDAISALKSAIE